MSGLSGSYAGSELENNDDFVHRLCDDTSVMGVMVIEFIVVMKAVFSISHERQARS